MIKNCIIFYNFFLIIIYNFSSFSYLLYFGAHFAKIEERKKILATLLISYSAYELSKSPVIHLFLYKQGLRVAKILAISGLKVA